MQISYKGDYSLKVILDLVDHYPDNLVHIEDLAKRQDIPQKFLEQILLDLKRGGFLVSKKGPKGGYSLSRSPENILLGDVIRYVEGPVYPISCIDPNAKKSCDEINTCVFAPVWKDVEVKVAGIIDSINFKQLKEREKEIKSKTVINFQI